MKKNRKNKERLLVEGCVVGRCRDVSFSLSIYV